MSLVPPGQFGHAIPNIVTLGFLDIGIRPMSVRMAASYQAAAGGRSVRNEH
jgi:hypothetical protein